MRRLANIDGTDWSHRTKWLVEIRIFSMYNLASNQWALLSSLIKVPSLQWVQSTRDFPLHNLGYLTDALPWYLALPNLTRNGISLVHVHVLYTALGLLEGSSHLLRDKFRTVAFCPLSALCLDLS